MSENVSQLPDAAAVLPEAPQASDAEATVPNAGDVASVSDDDIGDPAPVETKAAPAAETESSTDAGPQDIPALTPNAKVHYQTKFPANQGSPDHIPLPGTTPGHLQEVINALPQMDLQKTPGQRHWAEVLRSSQYNVPLGNHFNSRLTKQGSQFQQFVSNGEQRLGGRKLSFARQNGVSEVEGEKALIQVMSYLGIGGMDQSPMWASGFYVTFKPATDLEFLELNRIIASDKINAGRWSYGLSFSNTSVYTLERVFAFAMDHVYNTSVKPDEMPISALREYLKPQDIYSFIWGFLKACYPSGFRYSTSCINDPTKCTQVHEGTLNLQHMQYPDDTAFTPWQRRHMSRMKANAMTLEDVKRYQSEFAEQAPKRVILGETTRHPVAMTLVTPTINQYIEQGHIWIGGMVEAINASLGVDVSDNKRNEALAQMVKATAVRQFSHWIESVELGDVLERTDGSDEHSVIKITDPETLAETLERFSSDDALREEIIQKVLEYQGNSTVAVIGVEAYNCPKCHLPQEGNPDGTPLENPQYPRHTHIIPLDLLQVFFALLGQRLRRIEQRDEG